MSRMSFCPIRNPGYFVLFMFAFSYFFPFKPKYFGLKGKESGTIGSEWIVAGVEIKSREYRLHWNIRADPGTFRPTVAATVVRVHSGHFLFLRAFPSGYMFHEGVDILRGIAEGSADRVVGKFALYHLGRNHRQRFRTNLVILILDERRRIDSPSLPLNPLCERP